MPQGESGLFGVPPPEKKADEKKDEDKSAEDRSDPEGGVDKEGFRKHIYHQILVRRSEERR